MYIFTSIEQRLATLLSRSLIDQPILGLLVLLALIAILGRLIARTPISPSTILPLLGRLLGAALVTLVFAALIIAFHTILSNSITDYNQAHLNQNYTTLNASRAMWGQPISQNELAISSYIEKTDRQFAGNTVPNDSSSPPLYKDVPVRVPVAQNYITAVNAVYTMHMNKDDVNNAPPASYTLDAKLEYTLLNDSDLTTQNDYYLVLQGYQKTIQNFQILQDDKDMSSALRVSGSQLTWQGPLDPHQQSKVVITYTAMGTDSFYYIFSAQRVLKNFSLTVTVDNLPLAALGSPVPNASYNLLKPTTVVATDDKQGTVLTWTLDKSINNLAPIGLALPQSAPTPPSIYAVLNTGPFALLLLTVTTALTLLILGQPLAFFDLVRLAGVYCVQFLMMIALSGTALGFWGALILSELLTLILTYFLFRHYTPRLLRILILILVAFFAVIYPLSGLIVDATQAINLNNLIEVGLLIYLFVLSLYARLHTPVTSTSAAPADVTSI